MRLTGVLVTVTVALLLQALLSRYTIANRGTIDFVLIGIIYCGLRWGPVAGMLAGTLGGLLHDLITGDIVGVGGLAKTLVGFASGAIGAQFVLVRPQARMIIVAVATILHRAMMIGLYALIDQSRDPVSAGAGVPWSAILIQTGLNAACAFVVFQVTEAVPGAIDRQRASRRASLNRRKW